jgi:UDP-N-acetylglucosamine 2-epimerase
MKSLKIVTIVGARPQFIKYFPVSKAIQKFNSNGETIDDILVHTGQHYDYAMSKVFFNELGIKEPDYHLDVGSSSHGKQTAEIIKRLEEILEKERPSAVLTYGDTNSTLAAAIAVSKLHIPLGHVEAGLRSFNKYMPEEINRILTDHVSDLLLCPSEVAIRNLQNEGFEIIWNDGKLISLNEVAAPYRSGIQKANKNRALVVNVGDVMYDVLLYSIDVAEQQSDIIISLDLEPGNYVLLTLHRAENTDNLTRFGKLVDFVNEMSRGKTVVFPIHPRTRKVYQITERRFADNIVIIEPVSYFDILMLLKNCEMVMTDSGGIQKEAYWLMVPCITLREETEWVETLESGWNVLYRDCNRFPKTPDTSPTAYGDGKAAERISRLLVKSLC